MPRVSCQQAGSKPTWNLKRPGGWRAYEELTDMEAEKITGLVDDKNLSIDE
jgi:hypothetical protein